MLKDRRGDILVALVLVAPFLAIYLLVFVYPTAQMFQISFTNAPLIGGGEWVGLANYTRLDNDPLFRRAVWNTGYFVLMTVVPGTVIALLIALGISRLKGRFQALILALFFLPYILPVSVVFLAWNWIIDVQYGLVQGVVKLFTGGEMSESSYTGPGRVALGPTLFGDIITLPIDGRTNWTIGKDAFLACTADITKESKSQGLGKALFSGEDLFVYRVGGQGLIWLTSFGAVDRLDVSELSVFSRACTCLLTHD
jgi:ABC-type sugar transport system permease subunit